MSSGRRRRRDKRKRREKGGEEGGEDEEGDHQQDVLKRVKNPKEAIYPKKGPLNNRREEQKKGH